MHHRISGRHSGIMALATLALVVGAAGACSSGLEPSQIELEDAKRRWDAAGISGYSMVITRGGIQGGSVAVRVTVTQGVVTDRRYVADGQAVPAAQAANFPNVEGLFALVEDAFDRASQVSVSFDEDLGFPVSLLIDYTGGRVDDDVVLAVSQFAPAA